MAEEIALANVNVEFHCYDLKVKTNQIFAALKNNNRNSLKIAGLLNEIHKGRLFAEDYESYELYAKEVFGLKKAQAYNLASVGNWILRDERGKVTSESVLPHGDIDWTTTKILALIQADIGCADAQRLCESGAISAEMSVSALKAALKDFNALQSGDADESEPDADESEPDADESEPDADESGGQGTAQHLMELITTAVKNAMGIMDEAAKSDVITDESRAAWTAAMASITQGYNALAALISDT